MAAWLLIIASCITATFAVPELGAEASHPDAGTCGTTGCGTRTCVNNWLAMCTNCGCNPCSDTTDHCWSCAGTDGKCYPYDCGTHCSTGPCMEGKDFVEKHFHNGTVFSAFPGVGSLNPTQKADEAAAL